MDYRNRALNPDADCNVWEAIPVPVEPIAVAKRESSEIVQTYPPIVHVVKWISIAFIVWVVFG